MSDVGPGSDMIYSVNLKCLCLNHSYSLPSIGAKLNLSEDQFVHWDKFEGVNAFPPSACEQYFYDVPVDSSIADVCDGYLALYEYNGDRLALEKAKALLGSLTRFQEPSGRILTLMVDFGEEGPNSEDFWLNSIWWDASQLLRLDRLLADK